MMFFFIVMLIFVMMFVFIMMFVFTVNDCTIWDIIIIELRIFIS